MRVCHVDARGSDCKMVHSWAKDVNGDDGGLGGAIYFGLDQHSLRSAVYPEEGYVRTVLVRCGQSCNRAGTGRLGVVLHILVGYRPLDVGDGVSRRLGTYG